MLGPGKSITGRSINDVITNPTWRTDMKMVMSAYLSEK